MKLKSLEIQGFKSFDDRTLINFDDHITGIVGPNGCGKSNIVDSIRWVMGEQSAKHLRGRAMEDIIFSGTQNRQANSLASVELTFITDGEHTHPQYEGCREVSVGRKLFRTGESEYYINKQPCRLKDITDFFLGTGVGSKAYSIIEQGRVGLVVMAKPEERRKIVEEAAGISKFKARKDAALRKMDSTTGNLNRLNDIIQEIERQKGTLERQAKKAEKFKVVRDELMDLDLKLASLSFNRSNDQQQEYLERIKELDGRETDLDLQVSENENWVEEERLKLVEVEALLNDLQQDVYEQDNHLKLVESRIQGRKDDIQRIESDEELLASEISEIRQELVGSRNGLEQVNDKLALAELDSAQFEVSVQEQEDSLQELNETSQELFESLEKVRTEYNEASSKLSNLTAKKENREEKLAEIRIEEDSDKTELDDITEKHKELEKLLKDTKKDLESIRQLKFTLGEQTDTLNDQLQQEEEKVQSERVELAEIREQLMQKKSRLQSLEELERNFEGYQAGPREILKRKNEGELDGILATVADIVETQSRYESAVSAVLGERVQHVVVQSHEQGIACANLLKSNQSGRSSFIPVAMPSTTVVTNAAGETVETTTQNFSMLTEDYLKPLDDEVETVDFNVAIDAEGESPRLVPNFKDFEGVQGLVHEFVELKPGYENLSKLLFGEVLLVDSLQNAVEAWVKTGHAAVTLDGEFVSIDGVLTGGTVENASKALLEKKREIKELGVVIQELVDKVKSKEEVCFDLERKIKMLKAEIESIKSTSHEEDLRFAKQEKDVLHFQKDLDNIAHRRGRLSQQIFEHGERISSLIQEIETLTEEVEQVQTVFDESLAILENKKSEEEQYREDLASKQELLTKEKILLAQAREQRSYLLQEVDRLIAEQNRLTFDLYRSEEQQNLLKKRQIFAENRLAFLEKLVQKILEQKNRADEAYQVQKAEFETLNGSILERESSLKEDRREHNQVKDEINDLTVKLTETRARITRLGEQAMERYQLILHEIYKDHIPNLEEFDVAESEERANELRLKMGRMGSVNLAAIDELTEIADRYDFLTKQKTDLEESLAALERAIQKINRTTKERFKVTYELINDKFQKLFPRLFKGGHAYLQLTDPENILETGVEIIAQPPGKKLQSISLLSGGEKALTAVSLLFAIFLIKPAPFCLLDEVDAPLDDANVDRYNDIVKEMAQRTQFIVITHNKRTMQVTDCLFGVTMQEPGVSQLVSVDLG